MRSGRTGEDHVRAHSVFQIASSHFKSKSEQRALSLTYPRRTNTCYAWVYSVFRNAEPLTLMTNQKRLSSKSPVLLPFACAHTSFWRSYGSNFAVTTPHLLLSDSASSLCVALHRSVFLRIASLGVWVEND